VKWYEAGGIEDVGRHRLGSGAIGMDAGARAESGGGGIGRVISDDRRGDGVVQEGGGCGGFLQEAALVVSAMGLSEEGTTADGGKSRSSGAGGVEKGGYGQPCRRKG
jgi:hypothetical protein